MTPMRWAILASGAMLAILGVWLAGPPVWTVAAAAPPIFVTSLAVCRTMPAFALHLQGAVIAAGGLLAYAVAMTASSSLRDLEVAEDRIAAARLQASSFPALVVRPDFAEILPALDALDAMAHRPQGRGEIWYPHEKRLQASLQAARDRGMDWLLLPRLVLWLEDGLRAGMDDPARTLDLLAAYLVLTGTVSLPEARYLGQVALARHFNGARDGEGPEGHDAKVRDRAEEILARDRPWIPVDVDLVIRARQAVLAFPLAELAYSGLRDSPGASELPDWRPTERLGPAFLRVFETTSGEWDDLAIPGFLTREGFHGVLLPALAEISATESGIDEVLGRHIDPQADLGAQVLRLYEHEYVAAWQGMLDGLSFREGGTADSRVALLRDLTSVISPFRGLVTEVAEQTLLTEPPVTEDGATTEMTDRAAAVLRALVEQDSGIVALPGGRVELHFAGFRALVAPGPDGLSPLDALQGQLAEAYSEMAVRSLAGPEATTEGAALRALRPLAASLPPPMDRWIGGLAEP